MQFHNRRYYLAGNSCSLWSHRENSEFVCVCGTICGRQPCWRIRTLTICLRINDQPGAECASDNEAILISSLLICRQNAPFDDNDSSFQDNVLRTFWLFSQSSSSSSNSSWPIEFCLSVFHLLHFYLCASFLVSKQLLPNLLSTTLKLESLWEYTFFYVVVQYLNTTCTTFIQLSNHIITTPFYYSYIPNFHSLNSF